MCIILNTHFAGPLLQSDFQIAGPVRKYDPVEQYHVEEYVAVGEAVEALEQDIFAQTPLESCEISSQIIETDANETEVSTICPSLVSDGIYSKNKFRSRQVIIMQGVVLWHHKEIWG